MKKQIIPGCVLLLFAVTIAVGSVTFLHPCVHEDGTVGACFWAGRALLGLGCLLTALALAAVFAGRAWPGVYLSAALVCVLGMLTPGTLIGLCRMDTMRCRAVMQPAMILLFAAAGLAALAGAFFSFRNNRAHKR